jgi:hypothetical protein
MSWKPQVKTVGSDKWGLNGLCFAEEDDALCWAYDLMLRWTAVTDYGACEVTDEVTHVLVKQENGSFRLEHVAKEEQS